MFGVKESREPIRGKFAEKVLEDVIKMKNGEFKQNDFEIRHEIVYRDRVCDYMHHLDDLGWSELIDSRWKEDITNIIKEYDPNVRQEDLEELYKLVLI
jgi:hypothetical protein